VTDMSETVDIVEVGPRDVTSALNAKERMAR
jgi:hypothetical protein